MVTFTAKVTEKWSGKLVKDAIVYINGVTVMGENNIPVKTDSAGIFELDMTTGTAEVCVAAEGYERFCQKLNIFANTSVNFIIKPIVRAL